MEKELTTRFSSLYEALLISDAERNIIRREPTSSVSDEDIAYLLGTASRFSLIRDLESAESARYAHYAYEIAVRVADSPSYVKQYLPMSELILSRLGNFPARRLLKEKTLGIEFPDDPFLKIESLVRESENRSGSDSSAPILTDFQVRLLSALAVKRYVSVSAPTSAGKSFTLEIDLLRRFRENPQFVAIFLVPTRALIRQVSLDLSELMRSNQLDVSVLSSPNVAADGIEDLARSIFVLTQERLATLLQTAPPWFGVDAFIVDEAQEVSKGERGQTLERALRYALSIYPNSTVFFSSPLRSNPSFLLNLFGRSNGASEHFVEYQAPVTQNMICLRAVAGAPKQLRVAVEIEGKEVELQVKEVPFKFRGNCLGHVAHEFTRDDETSIVFCNLPRSADRQAMQLYEDVGQNLNDPELDEFADFLRSEVHRLYRLSSFIRRGIAFHYSNIPQIVRGRIEELLRQKKLRFVCCTSTLLQGINLPAKNIFVENPKSGRGKVMEPGDFWNLVGRAGRLTHEYTGNVFKVYTKEWESEPDVGDRLVPIDSAFEVAIHQNTPALAFFCREIPRSSESEERWAEQAIASLYAGFISSGEHLSERFQEGPNRDAALKVDSFCEEFRAKQSLEDEYFQKNFYVHPQRLENLASFFREQSNIRSWMPLVPWNSDAYQRLVRIFKVIEDFFIQEGTQRHKYFALLALLWMRGAPLRELVKDRLDRQNASNDDDKANAEIRELFTDIEERIRYIYVKYTGIYNSILGAVLKEQQSEGLVTSLVPIHLFLEFGASTQTLINFMALGLSRSSAIRLQEAVRFRDDMDIRACRQYLDAINLAYSSLPEVCKAEISRVSRRSRTA